MSPKSSRDLHDCTLTGEASLLDAMQVLERNAVGIALILDSGGRLCGTLTDGDIRRALLQGRDLAAPVAAHMQSAFAAVAPGADRPSVLDLMKARGIQQVPIVDEHGCLRGLHLLRDILGAESRPNWGVIMAGGEGKRLRPLTDTVPKPMLRVAGRPILERIVLQLVGFGITHVYLAINYLGETIERHFGDGERFGCRIEYLREKTALGTAGALGLLPELPADPVLLMNGDLVTQANLGALLDFHESKTHAATVGVRRYLHSVPFGCVELAGQDVRGIEEKPCISKFVNSGIYALNPDLLAGIPAGVAYNVPDLLEQCIRRGQRVSAFEIHDDWIDIGRLEQWELATNGA